MAVNQLPTTQPKTLRDYQLEALEVVKFFFLSGLYRRVILALPTGTGKTLTFIELVAKYVRLGRRVLVLVHTDQLVQQTVKELREQIPGVDVGIVKAEKHEVDAQVIVASVQTLSRAPRREEIKPDFALVVADEAHHAVAESWMTVLTYLGVFEPNGPYLLGATATPERGDKAGLDEMFEYIAYQKKLLEMIEGGWLCDLRAIQIKLDRVDYSKLHLQMGDFNEKESAQILMDANAPAQIAAGYMKYAAGRKTLVFTPRIEVAKAVAEAFNQIGVPAESFSGETPLAERRAVVERFKSGETMVVTNCQVLAEGFDEPSVNCIIIARPTKSQPFYQQMIGRGTRLHPGKDDCLIMDFVGVTNRLDLVTASTLEGLELDPEGKESAVEKAKRNRVELECAQLAAADREALIAREVKLFKERRVHWVISTKKDLFILPLGTGQGSLVIRPEAHGDGWTLLRRYGKDDGYQREHVLQGVALDVATVEAEQIARDGKHAHLIDTNAPWRQTDRPASAEQRITYRNLGRNGGEIPVGASMSQASDLIALGFEKRSQWFDSHPQAQNWRGYR